MGPFAATVASGSEAWQDVLTRARWIEIGRILLTGILVFLYW